MHIPWFEDSGIAVDRYYEALRMLSNVMYNIFKA